MKYTVHGVSALALVAALAVTGCNRTDDDVDTTAVDPNPTIPEDTAQAPATVPQTDTTPDSAGMGEQAGAALDDAAVTAKVKAALLATDGISGTDISVETQQGRVILSGRVPDQMQAQRAEEVAESIEGVMSVENRIEVAAG